MKSTMNTAQGNDGLRLGSRKAKTGLLLPGAVIALIAFAVYFNTLFNGFVYDDMTQVLENRWIRDFKYLPDIFTKSVWSFQQETTTSNYYRPLMHLIYMVNYHIFGLNPLGFHLVNVLFHMANSVLVFLVAARLLASRTTSHAKNSSGSSARHFGSARSGLTMAIYNSLFTSSDSHFVAFIAALLFAVHPIHTEAVAWVAGLPDLLFTFWFLLSLELYIEATTEKQIHKGRYVLSVVSFFLSTLSKEPALTLPLILMGYDHLFGQPEDGFRGRWKRYLPYILISAFYFTLRLHALGGIAPERRYEHLSSLQHVINIFPLFSNYLEKLLLPVHLNAFHVFHPIASILEAAGIFSVAVAAAFVGITAAAYRKNRMACFYLLFLVVPLLPAFYIRGLGLNMFAERYLYLPSVGFTAVVAIFLTKMAEKSPRRMIALLGALALVAGLYSLGTIKRNAVWKENLTLFSDTVKKSPDAELPHKELGIALFETGRVNEAIAYYDKAIALNPSDFEVYNNRGLAFNHMGHFDRAIADFDKAIALNERSFEAYNNKGKIYGQTGSFDKAIEQFSKAIDIKSDFALAYGNRGLAYSLTGDFERALRDLNTAIEFDERYAEAYGTRGNIYLRIGNTELAVSDFRKACDLGSKMACDVLKLHVR